MENIELPLAEERDVFTVSSLNREARRLIESNFGVIWVEGEISNLARPSSGHMYWSLKDDNAQVRCAMFRQANRLLSFSPGNGQQVLARARVSLYETRGEFQLILDYLEEAGEGLLRRRFEELKRKLAAEGLFDDDRKKPLPPLPRRIGVVTSPTGAAVRDILTVLRRRFSTVPVMIFPTAVQGERAAEEIAQTLHAEGKIKTLHENESFGTRLARIADECGEDFNQLNSMDIGPTRRRGVFEFLRNKSLLDLIEPFIGPEMTCNAISHMRPKMPGTDVAFHQDAVFTTQ